MGARSHICAERFSTPYVTIIRRRIRPPVGARERLRSRFAGPREAAAGEVRGHARGLLVESLRVRDGLEYVGLWRSPHAFARRRCKLVLRKKYEPSFACPTVAVVLMTLTSLWLPTTGPRVTLCCVNLLVTIIWLSTLSEHHAGSVSTAPHVVFVSLCATLSCRVPGVRHRCPQAVALCRPMRSTPRSGELPGGPPSGSSFASVASSRLRQRLRGKRKWSILSHDPPMAAEMAEAPAPVPTNQEPRLREEWHAVSRALDRALFVAFVVTFISFRLVFAGHNWGGKSRGNRP
ncbi:hypothetical protein MTO96_012247 [Rhipicephalus appendiculatus]